MTSQQPTSNEASPRWQPVAATDRRVLGVLVEKAKTTPEQYPLTLNALRNGCNQKSNRFPVTQLDLDDIEESLTRLRQLGAVTIVHDSGRVPKYRHWMYDWLGVGKVELAVMAELLLRGAQTLGELRARSARMDPIPDLNALRPVLASLKAKALIVYLTPEGRGCVLTHALYLPHELEKLREQYGTFGGSTVATARGRDAQQSTPATASDLDADVPASATDPGRPAVPLPNAAPASDEEALLAEVEELRGEVGELRIQVGQLRGELTQLARRVGRHASLDDEAGGSRIDRE